MLRRLGCITLKVIFYSERCQATCYIGLLCIDGSPLARYGVGPDLTHFTVIYVAGLNVSFNCMVVEEYSKTILVTGRGGLQGFEILRIPHCLDNRITNGGEVVSLKRRPRFTPRTIFWYPILLEDE
jgi:hypothetical protein